ncbi:MAG: TlpA disulfide reductase family protein [Gallionellaceae bacterium]|nr:TlpA disulfide reductase family protein [Gallionellaceae bacterium]
MKALLPLLFLLLAGCGVDLPQAVPNGAPAPAFIAHTLDGRQVTIPGDFKGKVVALRFWADWCPYCGPEMRDIEPVYQRLKARGLEVVAVNAGQGPEAVAKFLDRTPVSYTVVLDREVKAVGLYGVIGLPYTYLIDRNGKVSGRIVGEATAEVFERQVTALLQ